MSVDDRVRRGMREVPPADPSGAYERVVEKRVRRRIVRRVQAIALAVAVVAGSAAGFVGLSRAFRPSAPPASPPTATPSESRHPTGTPTTSPEPGQDVGLAFNLCDVHALSHVDLLGDGTDGTVWTGAPLTASGSCTKDAKRTYVVAVDYTGDGLADDAWRALEWCIGCRPYRAVDLDSDGDQELVVLEQQASTPQFGFFDLRAMDGAMRVRPIVVAPPGDADAGFAPGEPLSVWTGGDEGFSGYVACEGFPRRPELVVAWADGPVDGPGSQWREVHVARLVIEDGAAQVIGSSNGRAASDADLAYPFGTDNRACGVDWNPF